MTRYAQTFKSPTFLHPTTGKRMPNDTGWQDRHVEALYAPKGFEAPIVGMIAAWAQYADTHAARYESGIGADYVLGVAWHEMGVLIHDLLNGELGRLDGGTLSSFLHTTMRAEGFNDE